MNLWEQLKERHKLVKVFKKSGVYLGNEERYIFPKIHSISPEKIVFTLPVGLDPKILKQNFYVFQQVYGDHITLEGDIKTYTLNMAQFPKKFNYDYDRFKPFLKGMKLPILCGADAHNQIFAYDMTEHPHLLDSGETGSGKSTQLRSILTTLIQAVPPNRLHFYMADLKLGELFLYEDVEHLQAPIAKNAIELAPILANLKAELVKRGELVHQHRVREVAALPDPPPYIILCIEEFSIIRGEKELMDIIEDIGSIGRTLGIFVILTTQRPDSKILEGTLKVNLTVRMGFRTADLINSRIIGTPGSEKITEPGRFLLKIPSRSKLIEIQSPYLSENEAEKILEGFKSRKHKNVSTGQKNASNDVIDLYEIKNNVFEVLDE